MNLDPDPHPWNFGTCMVVWQGCLRRVVYGEDLYILKYKSDKKFKKNGTHGPPLN